MIVLGGPIGGVFVHSDLGFDMREQVRRTQRFPRRLFLVLSRLGRDFIDGHVQRHALRQRYGLIGTDILAVKMGSELDHSIARIWDKVK